MLLRQGPALKYGGCERWVFQHTGCCTAVRVFLFFCYSQRGKSQILFRHQADRLAQAPSYAHRSSGWAQRCEAWQAPALTDAEPGNTYETLLAPGQMPATIPVVLRSMAVAHSQHVLGDSGAVGHCQHCSAGCCCQCKTPRPYIHEEQASKSMWSNCGRTLVSWKLREQCRQDGQALANNSISKEKHTPLRPNKQHFLETPAVKHNQGRRATIAMEWPLP